MDEAVEQGSTVVAESGRGVGVKSEPVLRSHRLPILQRLKQRLFLENVLGGRLGFFVWVSGFEGLVTPSYLWHLFVTYTI